jgi:hypothetical protein
MYVTFWMMAWVLAPIEEESLFCLVVFFLGKKKRPEKALFLP